MSGQAAAGPQSTQPAVQVIVIAYNQSSYIGPALDSILAQNTNFPVQILVHDDASTDGTREIIEEYAGKHPDQFRCILQSQNQYSQGRRIVQIVWPELTADYVALLDGDDLWTDPSKLQSQFDFMTANPDCAICHTKVAYFDQLQQKVIRHGPSMARAKPRLGLNTLALGNFIHTSTVLLRRSALPEIPDNFGSIGFGDYALFSLFARAGWIGFLNEPMALYRIHDANDWFSRPQDEREAKTKQIEDFILGHLSAQQRKDWIRTRDASFKGIARKVRSRWRNVVNSIVRKR